MSPYHAYAVDLSNAFYNAVRSFTNISHNESLSLDAVLHLIAHFSVDIRHNSYRSTWRYHTLLQYHNTWDIYLTSQASQASPDNAHNLAIYISQRVEPQVTALPQHPYCRLKCISKISKILYNTRCISDVIRYYRHCCHTETSTRLISNMWHMEWREIKWVIGGFFIGALQFVSGIATSAMRWVLWNTYQVMLTDVLIWLMALYIWYDILIAIYMLRIYLLSCSSLNIRKHMVRYS